MSSFPQPVWFLITLFSICFQSPIISMSCRINETVNLKYTHHWESIKCRTGFRKEVRTAIDGSIQIEYIFLKIERQNNREDNQS
ncbi:MAG: hypothetical protein C4530_02690 [Desulfobacteraceae bacterium]|nr:MAG: hypothetical protein C4530_02690 [Desulfobacteraceae bacterium]